MVTLYGIYIYTVYIYTVYIHIYIYIYMVTLYTVYIPYIYDQSEGLGTDYGSSWVRELTWALLLGGELFAAADPHGNRAGVSKFYFRCFQNATGSSSAPRKVPELRIELPATLSMPEAPR